MDVTAIQAAVTVADHAWKTAKALLDKKIDNETKNRLVELIDQITDLRLRLANVSTQLLANSEELRNLQEENRKLSEIVNRRDEYERFRAPGGAIVWKSKTEPMHYACPKCFEWGRFIPLQESAGTEWTGNYECPACDKSFQIKGRRDLSPNSALTEYDPYA